MADVDLNLPELYVFAVDLAKRAGQLLVAAAEKRRSAHSGQAEAVAMKLNSVDLVTETDERTISITSTSCNTRS